VLATASFVKLMLAAFTCLLKIFSMALYAWGEAVCICSSMVSFGFTWFSSWLWPFEVFKGFSNPGNADIKYYYPTNTLVTAPEIIFFWVARMIMAGFEYMGEKPFSEVYFTGIVRDKQGRKMSKSLGNSPDLLALIDQYGADAVRFGILVSSPAGNDLMFDESALEQGRNFNNKLWNALKLVRGWQARQSSMGNLFNKNIGGWQFNFQPIEFGTTTGYHVNVKDDEGTRWEFSILHADVNDAKKMKIEGTNVPSWIMDLQAMLIKGINEEE